MFGSDIFLHRTSPFFLLKTNVCLLALFLSACGGGSGGGGSQSPDPVVVDLPIAYVKRSVPIDVDDEDNDGDITEVIPENFLDPYEFNGGAALYIRDRAAPGADETNITDRAWPAGALYDVKDVEVSYDGTKLVFAMRAPDDPDLDDDEQAKWDIWEYELPTDILRPVIADVTTAQEANDIAPYYLADDRIVFSSDRQQRSKAILLDDGKTRYAAMHEDNTNGEYGFVLHVMDDDGQNIEQITYNQSHDLQPTVLSNGRILFLRWDNYTRNNISLYTINPDGSDQQVHYGFHSQDTGTNIAGTNDIEAVFSQPRAMPSGQLLVNLKPRTDDRFGGDMVLIDAENFVEIDQPTAANTGTTNPGQASASLLDVLIDGSPSPHGRFNSVFPFFDGTDRLLVTWNQCRLINPDDPDPANPTTFVPCTDDNLALANILEAPPLYGVWIYNPTDGTQLPVISPEDGIIYTDAVAMEPRDRPTLILPLIPADSSWVDEGVGVVHIRSVYDIDGTDAAPGGIAATSDPGQAQYATRPARFLRITKAVSQPDNDTRDFDNNAFGVAGAQRMKEILGYVPIEPDGSVKFKVPADVAFTISIHDDNIGRIRPRHQNWMQVRSGETLECNGCHTRNSEAPHGRRDAEPASLNLGAATNGPLSNSDVVAEMGETMAETYARTNGGPRTPNFNIEYTDTFATAGLKDADITLKYTDTDPAIGLNTTPPASIGCQNVWNSSCRGIINYEQHIQPIWDYVGRTNDANASAVCVDCHNKVNNVGAAQVPAGQLELTGDPIGALNRNPNQQMLWVMSYLDLFVDDFVLELDAAGTTLIRRTVPQDTGEVDADGNPIIVDVPVLAPSPISTGNFFNVFSQGGSHNGGLTRLSPHELKLISEWLDIGAQYYNNPFDAPLN
ncbi:MAG: hypothetical protein ACRBCS_04680 [Cellvibrionaceae bacterium]